MGPLRMQPIPRAWPCPRSYRRPEQVIDLAYSALLPMFCVDELDKAREGFNAPRGYLRRNSRSLGLSFCT